MVYAAPSYSYTVYVMDHCDWYGHLCGHMYYHSYYYGSYYDDYWDDYWDERHEAREDWQRHFEETREDRQEYREERREEFRENHGETLEQAGNGGMSEAVKDWKEKNGDSLPKDFFKEDGSNYSAVRQCMSSLNFLFNIVLEKNIMLSIPYPKGQHKIPVVLTKKEVSQLFHSTTNPKHLLLLNGTGRGNLR